MAIQSCTPPNPFEGRLLNLLCQLNNLTNGQLDSEIAVFCDSANSNVPVIVRYRFAIQNSTISQTPTDAWNLDGTAFTGSYSTLVSCANIVTPALTKGRQATTITSSVAETVIVTSNPENHLDIYSLLISNTSDTDCEVTIREATGGAVAWNYEVPTHDMRGFTVPVESATPQTAIANNWTAQCALSLVSIKVTVLYRLRF